MSNVHKALSIEYMGGDLRVTEEGMCCLARLKGPAQQTREAQSRAGNMVPPFRNSHTSHGFSILCRGNGCGMEINEYG